MNKIQVIRKVNISGYSSLTNAEKDVYNSTDMRLMIYETAKSCIGKKMSPIYRDYGCMEAVNAVVMLAIGNPIGGGASTYLGYKALKTDKERFKEMEIPLPGDVVISPSGYGNGKIKNGHIGIVSDGNIMSNNSATLKWDTHWTLEKWIGHYGKKGGFPVEYFRVLS